MTETTAVLRLVAALLAGALAACSGSPAEKKSSLSNVVESSKPGESGGEEAPKPAQALAPRRFSYFAPDVSAETFASSCRAGLDRAKARLPAILDADGPRTEESFLKPYNEMMMDLDESSSVAGLMRSVHPSKEVRAAAEKCEQEVAKFQTGLTLNRRLYEGFAAVDKSSLEPDARRLVEHTLRDFRRAGVDKDDATRKRLKEIDEKLVELDQQFSKNLAEDVRTVTLDSKKDLAGLPDDYVKAHLPKEKGEKIQINTDYPDYIPFMAYADSTRWRKKLYIARRARGGEENEKILHQMLELRKEKATILGYDNWADYITEDKMMKSAKKASEFIARVVKTADDRASKDYAELLAWKKAHMNKRARRVEDYEKTYIENKVKAQKLNFDPQEVRPYFPFDEVEKGLLDVTSRIYGVTYRPAEDAVVWHEDVHAYDVVMDGRTIGRIYLDLHPRDGKYKHAAQFTLLTGVAGERLPEGALVCNFPNPRTDPPALMEHDDVVTTFHEFGHLMHHIFGGNQRWVEQSGVATEWDFVEAPSQMFEEWAWRYPILKTFARHYETGEVIPEDLVDRMQKARKFGIGVATVQQMFYAAISLNFHTADPDKLDMMAETKRLQKKYTPFAFVPGTRFYANFGHLTGYSAMYYTYMWSLVIAKDLLSPFEKHGFMNTEWTHRYRDKILAPGGTRDASQLIEDFLGRPLSFDAFEHYLEGE